MSAGRWDAVDGAFGIVLPIQDRRCGLAFWNQVSGLGSLFDTTAFVEATVAVIDVLVADDQAECLAMSAPLVTESGT